MWWSVQLHIDLSALCDVELVLVFSFQRHVWCSEFSPHSAGLQSLLCLGISHHVCLLVVRFQNYIDH